MSQFASKKSGSGQSELQHQSQRTEQRQSSSSTQKDLFNYFDPGSCSYQPKGKSSRKRSVGESTNSGIELSSRKRQQSSRSQSKLAMEAPSSLKNGVNPTFSAQLSGGNTGKPKQAKKLVIKNLKVKPQLPSSYGEEVWATLKEAVDAIHLEKAISSSLEGLYQAVENCCTNRLASSLYEQLKKTCQKHIEMILPIFSKQYDDEVEFLRVVNSHWQKHCQQMLLIRNIFLYLDRTYVVQSTGVLPIWELGLHLFGSMLVEPGLGARLYGGLIAGNEYVQFKLLRGVLDLIRRERHGETIDKSLLKSLLHMLMDIQVYHEIFEVKFLLETQLLYHAEGQGLVNGQDFTLPVYLQHVQKRLHQEEERSLQYLEDSTRRPLILCLEKELISGHINTLVTKGFDNLIELNRIPDLLLMFQLFTRVDGGQQSLCLAFLTFIKKTGIAIVSDAERDKTMIDDLLALKEKADHLVKEAFGGDTAFVGAIREAFETAVNKRQNKPAELLAKFVDSQLRSGNKEWTDEEMEKLLDRVLILFRFIHGKDIFEAFYKKDLAKRLLVGKSASVDAEKSMLLKLKQECGAQFTSKLEGMFKDIELSKDLVLNFKQHFSSRRLAGNVDLYVNVLTMGYWPTYPAVTVTIPTELNHYLECFKDYYLSKHSGRKLAWQPNLGHCQVRAVFTSGEKELQVSFFQTLVILLFNDAERLTYEEIKQATDIEDGELKRTLQSLALGKARVLLKSTKGKDIVSSDKFTVNREFKHKLFKIKINQVQLRETAEENQATNERVFQDRQYQIDAAIVRIMKMRKTLAHNLLIAECFEQLRFPVKPSDLKKRIESLIERDYVKRDDDNPQIYCYVA